MKEKDILIPSQVDALQALVANLQAQLLEKDGLLLKQEQELALLYAENQKLRHRLNKLLQDKFGSKSEKDKSSDLAFDEAMLPNNQEEIELAEKEISVTAHTRKTGRKPLPQALPRVQKFYELSACEQVCACGHLLHKIGEEISEQLDIVPAKVQVIQHVKYKLCDL